MNDTERMIYGTAFANAYSEIRKQSLVAGVSFNEIGHQFCAQQAFNAVLTFRETFETLVYEVGEEQEVTQLYMDAAEIVCTTDEDDDYAVARAWLKRATELLNEDEEAFVERRDAHLATKEARRSK